MKNRSLTIRVDDELAVMMDRVMEYTGRSRSEIARDALRRQLRVSQFDHLRKRTMPFAEARGYLTDEDIFAEIS